MAERKRKASGGGCGTLLVVAIALSFLTDSGNAVPWAALLVLGGIGVGVWLLWRYLARPKTPTAKELSARLDGVTSIGGSSSGAHFETGRGQRSCEATDNVADAQSFSENRRAKRCQF